MFSASSLRRWAAALLLGFGAGPGCSREGGRAPYVARVGSEELSAAEVAATRDSAAGGAWNERAYVNEWVTEELLYLEAQRRGLTGEDEFARRLEAARRHLAIAALLEREIYSPEDTAAVTEDAITAAFRAAPGTYALREDVVLVQYVLFADRDNANTFRSLVLRGTPWGAAVRQARQDTAMNAAILEIADRQYRTQATLFPEEVWKVARSLATGEVSFAVKAGRGFFVVQMLGLRRQGETPDLDYVRSEVRDNLLIERRRSRYNNLLGELRARFPIDVSEGHGDPAGSVTD